MKRIPADEVTFHPHSFADPAGRLFWWNGELYRGLQPEWSSVFKSLLRSGTLQRLTRDGLLIDTSPTDFAVDGYEMVVRHRVIPFVSYPEEWCPSMLKDAAIILLDLLINLAHSGLTLKDCHPWNLVFDRGRPIYVDLTSITPIREIEWRGYDEFCRFYRNPLILMGHNQERIARRLLLEYEGVLGSDVSALIRPLGVSFNWAGLLAARFKRKCNWLMRVSDLRNHDRELADGENLRQAANSLVSCFEKVKEQIENLSLPFAGFANDPSEFEGSFSISDSWTITERAVQELQDQLKPRSVFDLGTPKCGWYSRAASASGRTALAVSTDSAVLTQLYTLARKQRSPLLPIVMEFTDPTPSRGLCSHWSIAASERLKCDMVLALGNIHQLVFQRSLTFEQIVEGFASFSKRWVIAEFLSAENQSCRNLAKIPWYSVENFLAALRRRFHNVTRLAATSAGRILIMAEK